MPAAASYAAIFGKMLEINRAYSQCLKGSTDVQPTSTYGLSAILVFLGFKMLSSGIYEMPVSLSLGVVLEILLISVFVSVLQPRKKV